MSSEFSRLRLHPDLVQTVTNLGYTTPTPIQAAVIPVMLAGQDVIGQAQTGTGKTAAFSLPILHDLTLGATHVQCLVLAPTRELAVQVAKTMESYGRDLGVRVLAVYGGQPYAPQIRSLRQGVDVVVGTPGRLIDLMKRNVLDLSQVNAVVLDEADEMLSMGFVEDIETILSETPSTRRTALFSATVSPEIRRLANKYMHKPQSITIETSEMTVSTLEQRYYLVNGHEKAAALTRIFEVEAPGQAIIFVRTRAGTGELTNELVARGIAAEALNGDMSQDSRTAALNRFRKGQISVLVATDVAARGLDIDDISHVFNYDIPTDPEVYVHRVGRTGRAGRDGIAITLITPKEQWPLRRIEQYTKQKLEQHQIPSGEKIQQMRDQQLVERMKIWLERGRCQRERELIAELADGSDFDLMDIAAAALKLARSGESDRPIAHVSEVRSDTRARGDKKTRQGSSPRGTARGTAGRSRANHPPSRKSHEDGMVRLSLNTGRDNGVRPNEVVATLAFHADIPGNSIGKIQIEQAHTLVDVPAQFAAKVLANTGNYRIRRQPVQVAEA